MKYPIVFLVFPICLLLLLFLSTPLVSISNKAISIPASQDGAHGHHSDSCNFSSGRWILDTTKRPLYSADCPFHRSVWNCGKNKKPEAEKMSQWTWKPSKCSPWASIKPHSFLRATQGMRLGFIGDSLNENFMVSLLCSLSAVDAKARKWKRRGAWRGAYFPSQDVTVGYHRAVVLSKINLAGTGSGFRVDIDIPADDWSNVTQFYDVLVFNTGHWWGYDKFPEDLPLVFYKQGRPVWPPLSIREGLAAVLKSMLEFIDDSVPATVLKVWRLQSPRHFHGGEWNQNGSCSSSDLLSSTQVEEWFDPANGGVNREEREVNDVIRSALNGHHGFVLLDVAKISEFRADAHPSLWLGGKDTHLVWGQDCLHWCLPGLPDTWVDMLVDVVLKHVQSAQ
uniref:Trichome birefringence-like N-terminal domain-containing protein n=1 Tax=Physcomitrium patens TaxID=3218 RepID=A0A7I4FQ62_PHYPA